MDAAIAQVIAHEREVLVARGIPRYAQLLAVLRQMPIAEENAVESGLVLRQPIHWHEFGGNREADVIAALQLPGIDPVGAHLAFGEPFECALFALLERHAGDRPERVPVGYFQRLQRMLYVHTDHRIILVVDEPL